ncbi:MAG TPA: hypothetical protein PLV92_22040, partial [Pirellulaceae bacterium]|nr:hypothetical protein [Pirellulaceae bacterium]
MKQGQGAGNWDVKPQRSQDDRSDVAIGGDARQAKTNFERMLKNDLGQVQIAKQFALTVDGKLLEAQKPETVNLPLAADLMPLAEKLLADAKQLDSALSLLDARLA